MGAVRARLHLLALAPMTFDTDARSPGTPGETRTPTPSDNAKRDRDPHPKHVQAAIAETNAIRNANRSLAVVRETARARIEAEERFQRSLRRARAKGCSLADIGDAAGLTRQTIHYLLRGDPRRK